MLHTLDVYLKEISPGCSLEGLMLKLEILCPPHVKSWLIGKDSDAGRDWGQEEKGSTEDEVAGWHHRLDGQEFGWTPGVGDGQGGLACCNSWGCKKSDMTEQLNWTYYPPEKSYQFTLLSKLNPRMIFFPVLSPILKIITMFQFGQLWCLFKIISQHYFS